MTMRSLSLLAGVFWLSGCATIDFDYPREASYVIEDTGDTYLAREREAVDLDFPADYSGFYPLPDGVESLAARLLLAERAEKTIDAQYYLIKNDIVGRAFIHVLLKAADRGVRVRLLIDDMFTAGNDVGIAALDSHPNFEIRIYNPFYRGAGGKVRSAVTGFSRINRRMHNKSFTLDNKVTVIGGRNIADEYFGAREDKAFGDLDAVAIGPVVDEVSAMFDQYWNHETALPIPAFIKPLEDPAAALDNLRASLARTMSEIENTDYANAVAWQVYDYMATDEELFNWSPYQLVYDSPDKGVKSRSTSAASIRTPLRDSIVAAENELLIVSPYFVPLKSGINGLLELESRGVDVTVITNSLAANNQFMVHAGYKPSRKPLLEGGVDLYEVRPDSHVDGTEFVDASGATATLHTKAFIVDRKQVFIGSFNFDPRSANLNTEMGVIIHDPAMGERFLSAIEEHYDEFAYEVFLDADGRVRWRGMNGGQEVVYTKEPETSWWDRFKVGFAGLFPIKQQL